MKIARLDPNGKIVEFFEATVDGIPITKRFPEEFLKTLVRLDNLAQLGDYIISGANIGPRPSQDHEIIDGKWAISEQRQRELDRQKARAVVIERLKTLDLTQFKDPAVRQFVEGIVILLT